MTHVQHGVKTVVRSLTATPAQVFAAFADLSIRRTWFRVPGATLHELDFRTGGGEYIEALFTANDEPEEITYTSHLLDIVPDARIIFAYSLTLNGIRRQTSLVTVSIDLVATGTSLTYTEQYALLDPPPDGPDAAHLEGSIPLMLNGLARTLNEPLPRFQKLTKSS